MTFRSGKKLNNPIKCVVATDRADERITKYNKTVKNCYKIQAETEELV